MKQRIDALILAITGFTACLASCLGPLEPDVGPLVFEACVDGDQNPRETVRFRRDISRGLFSKTNGGCMSCHDPSQSAPIGVTLGGLDLTSYDKLLSGGARSGADCVRPNEPCQSVLHQKLSPSPPFGSRMPAVGPYFDDASLELVADWIAEGAHDN